MLQAKLNRRSLFYICWHIYPSLKSDQILFAVQIWSVCKANIIISTPLLLCNKTITNTESHVETIFIFVEQIRNSVWFTFVHTQSCGDNVQLLQRVSFTYRESTVNSPYFTLGSRLISFWVFQRHSFSVFLIITNLLQLFRSLLVRLWLFQRRSRNSTSKSTRCWTTYYTGG